MRKKLQPGTRVKLKVRLMSGYKGFATVVFDDGLQDIEILKDGDTLNEYGRSYCYVFPHEVSVCRKQLNQVSSPDQSQTSGSTPTTT